MIKKITLGTICALTVACSNIKFDGLQYDRFVNLYEEAGDLKELCGVKDRRDEMEARLNALADMTGHMNQYSKFRSASPEVARSTETLHVMVTEIQKRYAEGQEPSTKYCTEKMQLIQDGTRTVTSTLGAQ